MALIFIMKFICGVYMEKLIEEVSVKEKCEWNLQGMMLKLLPFNNVVQDAGFYYRVIYYVIKC